MRENENLILDCIQMEGGLDSIKHEDAVIDDADGSPGGDPSTEGHCGQGASSEPQTASKSDAESHKTRTRNTAGGTQSQATLNLKENHGTIVLEEQRQQTHHPVITPIVSKRGQKRKSKVTAEELNIHIEPPKTSPSMSIVSEHIESTRSRHPSVIEEHTESSVKELENAMSKHLPSPGGNNTNTDFSADALLKQQQQQQEKSSTIQWIGTHANHSYHQQPAPMPATALLRQLYANRESVIRATARQTPTGVYYGEGQAGPLPTPPGSESSFDNQFLQLHGHSQKSSDAFTNLVTTYGGYHSSIDYHNAMTPPSSVSPRESANSLNVKNIPHPSSNSYEYPEALRGQYNPATSTSEANATPSLPLKPQPYSAAAAAMHHHAASTAATTIDPAGGYSSLDQSQYFSPHSSFHLYHKGGPSAGWYTTPS